MSTELNDLQASKVDDLIELGWEVVLTENEWLSESAVYRAEHNQLGKLWLIVRPDGSHKFQRKIRGQAP